MPPYDVKIIEICVDDCPEEVGASVVNEVTIPFTQAELLTDWTTGHKQSLLCPALERVYLYVYMYVCMYVCTVLPLAEQSCFKRMTVQAQVLAILGTGWHG